jgi:type IV pilus assembly protein PilV
MKTRVSPTPHLRHGGDRHAFEAGFTLIEVMVAIVILSFGMLGVAALMVTGIQFTHSAQQRTIATQLAYDMIDRMRSNQADWSMSGGNADAGVNYNMPSTDPYAVGSPYLNETQACIGYTAAGTGCNTTGMASQDAYEWQRTIRARLANGVGIVCRDNSNSPGTYSGVTITHQCNGVGPKYAIKIYWLDDRSSDSTTVNPNGGYRVFMTTFIP